MMSVIAISWYIVGILIFLTMAVFEDYSWWGIPYYLWDKAKDMLFIWAIIKPAPFMKRKIFYPILIYAAIRALWEIISFITGIAVNNTTIVGVLFIIMILICIFITLKEWSKLKL